MKRLSQKTKINTKCLHKGKGKWRYTLYYSNSEFRQTKKGQPPVQRLKEASPTIPGPRSRRRLLALSWRILASEILVTLLSHSFSPYWRHPSACSTHFLSGTGPFHVSLSLLQTQSLLLLCSSLTSQNLALCWVYTNYVNRPDKQGFHAHWENS